MSVSQSVSEWVSDKPGPREASASKNDPPPLPYLSGHVNQLTIRNKTKKGHNIGLLASKKITHIIQNSFRGTYIIFRCFFFNWGGGGVSALLEFSNIFFFFEAFP